MKTLWKQAPNPAPPGILVEFEKTGHYAAITPEGWDVDDVEAAERFCASYNPLKHCRDTRIAELAAKRAEVVAGGVTTSAEISLWTDPASIASLTALSHSADMSAPSVMFAVKARDGTWHELSSGGVRIAVYDVLAFVQKCFAHEKSVADKINAAATWQEVWAINAAAGFPPNS